jgi:DNA repair protein RadC
MAPHELAVIDAALAIVALKLRQPGAVCDTRTVAKEFLRLHLAGADRELFCVLFVDVHYSVIAFEVMFTGSLTQTSVYPREVVRRALELNAAAVILSHNHPSGSAEPSRADEYLTQTLKAALKLVDVEVHDHIIVSGMATFSLAEHGLL